jgi:hypothetical protein
MAAGQRRSHRPVAWVLWPLHFTSLLQFLLDELWLAWTFQVQSSFTVLMSPTRAASPNIIGLGWRTRLQWCLMGVTA